MIFLCGTGTGVPSARGFHAMGWRLSCRCLIICGLTYLNTQCATLASMFK
jgi:hypothetical protein